MAKTGFSSTGKNPSTAARSPLTKSNAANAPPARGPTPEWPSRSEITLSSQERGKEWEYRVLAVNKAGEGEASNTIMAVL